MAASQLATLNILSERIIRELSGGDIPNDSPYDPFFVIETLRDALNEELKTEIFRRRQGDSDDRSPITQYIFTYAGVAVQVDSVSGRAYAELPSYFLSLKYNKGIRSISTDTNNLNPMIRIANPGVTSKLPHALLETTNYSYYVEGMRVFWTQDITKAANITKVTIKLIIAAAVTMDNDDPLPLTPENLARVMDVTKARVQNKVTQDRIEDNNPNLRQTNEARR